MLNYSQNNEQDVILDYFSSRVGRFLDIGAFDGITLSNTRALAELGWSGVAVEPSPYNLCSLIESVKEFSKRVSIWGCAVSDTGEPATLKMTSVRDRLWATTISPDIPDSYIPDLIAVNLTVPTVRISDLLKEGPFNFISIDAEWMDFKILKDSPRLLGGCELLCVEPSGLDQRKEMIAYLDNALGFTVHYETNENIIAKRKTH